MTDEQRRKIDDRLRLQFRSKCVHFRGVQHPTCRAGVVLAEIRPRDGSLLGPLPCLCIPLGSEPPGECASRRFPSEEEVDARLAQVRARFAEIGERLAANQCPDCGTPVERRRRVGRCVYLEPCGHRLGQV